MDPQESEQYNAIQELGAYVCFIIIIPPPTQCAREVNEKHFVNK